MKKYNNEKYIVNITSFGKRIKLADKTIFNLYKKQSFKDIHITVTLFKEDFKYFENSNLKLLADNDIIEIITADVDLGPHNKYFYVMKKYHDKPIITFDDDQFYLYNCIEKMDKLYNESEKKIIANCAIKTLKRNNKISNYTQWVTIFNRLKPNIKSYIAMAEGFSGILYPPNCFENLESYIPEILECKYDDDLFLHVLEIRHKIPVIATDYPVKDRQFPNFNPYELHTNQNRGGTNRNNMCKKFEKDLLKGFELK